MSIQINGTSGISGVDGSAGTPALQGSDTNTGISFGTDTVNINTGGTTRATVDSSGRLLLGSTSTVSKLFVSGGSLSVSGSDNDFASGGNRVLIDHDATNIRFGATGGGTSWTRGISFLTSNSSTTNTEVFRIASDGSFSGVVPSGSTLYPAFWCRAWVNFNGTGTVAIRASGNVSSITDNAVGDYTVNFTTAMPDANYAACIMGGSQTSAQTRLFVEQHDNVLRSTTQLRIYSLAQSFATADAAVVSVAIFR